MKKSWKDLSLSKSNMDFVCDTFETITFQESQLWKSSNIPLNALIFNLNVFLTCYKESLMVIKHLWINLITEFTN